MCAFMPRRSNAWPPVSTAATDGTARQLTGKFGLYRGIVHPPLKRERRSQCRTIMHFFFGVCLHTNVITNIVIYCISEYDYAFPSRTLLPKMAPERCALPRLFGPFGSWGDVSLSSPIQKSSFFIIMPRGSFR